MIHDRTKCSLLQYLFMFLATVSYTTFYKAYAGSWSLHHYSLSSGSSASLFLYRGTPPYCRGVSLCASHSSLYEEWGNLCGFASALFHGAMAGHWSDASTYRDIVLFCSNMPDRWRASVLTLYSFMGLALCIIALHNIHKDNEVTRTTRIHSEEYLTYIQRVSWELERESSIFITSVDNVSFVSLTSTLVDQNENYSTALSSFLRRIYTLHTHETDLHLLVNKQIGNSN